MNSFHSASASRTDPRAWPQFKAAIVLEGTVKNVQRSCVRNILNSESYKKTNSNKCRVFNEYPYQAHSSNPTRKKIHAES